MIMYLAIMVKNVSFSTKAKIPGELPHTPPDLKGQQRFGALCPYVREANEVFRETWHLKERKLFDFLLVHILRGTGRFTVADETFNINTGDLIWIPPNTLHEMRGDAPGTKLQYIHFDLIYDPKRSHWSASIPAGTVDLSRWKDRIHPPLDDSILRNWCGKLDAGNQTRVTELLRKIVFEYNRTQTSRLTIAGLVLQLTGHLMEAQQASSLSNRQIRAVENAMQQIQMNETLNLEILSRQYGLSSTHFRKLFREHFGHSPREARQAAKMKAACDALVYSELSVSEIADRLGFTNIHNFSRAFRKAIGRAPTAYRNGHAP
ncbi:helix-turn-helix domain-containing protein [Tichowtungia aerotolerans]|uniref:Helix-turn-helix domain-containing protein n=1 Tax=Tichowtungia aerotolerans TaxID=2697043 RepID=A0A6P1M6Z1_9BACT|nr:AraC family transcriptional regulator [Tichowtungia aerotolerans]QHI68783.1 helix-turn-helix domain-containing protein [Tichowtungia aerotolerans]